MDATLPPPENSVAVRAAIIELARDRLSDLFPDQCHLADLKDWLWCLPAHRIAMAIRMDPRPCATYLAQAIEADTHQRYRAERFVEHLAEHHPRLSHTQRSRLAELALAIEEIHDSCYVPNTSQLMAKGFSLSEIERLKDSALRLIKEVRSNTAVANEIADEQEPHERLRQAGQTSADRRQFAIAGLPSFGAAEAARAAVAATPEVAQ